MYTPGWKKLILCHVQIVHLPAGLLKEYHRTKTSNMENTKTEGNRSVLERDNLIRVKQCMP